MPGTTPNRGYPFPVDTDGHDTAGHIEDLARAVDTDTNSFTAALNAEATTRANADAALQTNRVNAFLSGWNKYSDLLIQGSWSAIALDGFSHGYVSYPIPYVMDPVIIVSGGTTALPIVATTGLFTGVPNTPSGFHIVAATKTGGSLPDAILVFYWLAAGFQA